MKFVVVWKGKVIGSFTRAEIEDAVGRGELGILHRVRLNSSDEVSVGDFLKCDTLNLSKISAQNPNTKHADFEENVLQKKAEFAFEAYAYVLAGLSFLSMMVLFSSYAYSIFLFLSGKKNDALKCAVLSSICAVAGIVFFRFLNSL